MTKPRKRGGAADKAWSLGLAGAACLGLVGLVGVRSISDAAANETAPPADSTTANGGLSQAELDAYAASLDQQRAQLDDYRAQLVATAQQLQVVADTLGVRGNVETVLPASQKPKQRQSSVPRAQAAPQLQAAPQGKTRSS